MTRPADVHSGAGGTEAARFAQETLRGFRELGVRPIMVGGWALSALGSPIPSIDMDCWISEKEWDRREVHDFVDARADTHRKAQEDAYLEVSALEWPNRLWRSSRGYRPADLVARDGLEEVEIQIDGEDFTVSLPRPESLLFTKWKAFRDRSVQFLDVSDPRRLALLFEEDLEKVSGLKPSFFLRKASKDLVDIAFLLKRGASPGGAARLARDLGVWEELRQAFVALPSDVRYEAAGLVGRFRMDVDIDRVVEEIQDVEA